MRFTLPDKIKDYIGKYSPVDRRVFLICIGLSSFFWFVKKMSNSYRTTWPVSISVDHPPEIDLVTAIPNNITVDLEGHGWDLMLASLGTGGSVDIQFEQSKEGSLNISKYLITKAIEQNFSNEKIKIEKLSTEGFSLSFDILDRKRVPLVLDYRIQPAKQFRLKGTPSSPVDSVWVFGPRVLLDTIFSIKNRPIELLDIKEEKDLEVELSRPTQQVSLEPSSILVNIPVEAETEKAIYVPLKVINAPVDTLSKDSLVVFPARVNIAFVVGLSEYNSISDADFEVVVDLSEMKKEATKTTAPILLKKSPSEVKNVTFSPKAARFFYVSKDTLRD